MTFEESLTHELGIIKEMQIIERAITSVSSGESEFSCNALKVAVADLGPFDLDLLGQKWDEFNEHYLMKEFRKSFERYVEVGRVTISSHYWHNKILPIFKTKQAYRLFLLDDLKERRKKYYASK